MAGGVHRRGRYLDLGVPGLDWPAWASKPGSRPPSAGWSRPAVASAQRSYRLRDWLFSRQRYWGEPFPIVYDEHGLPIALPEEAASAAARDGGLPAAADGRTSRVTRCRRWPAPGLGRASNSTWVTARNGTAAKLNTMPQWAGSCWYYLRYLDPANSGRWSTRRLSGTGWCPRTQHPATAASTCTWAVSSTPCCICSTPGSGTKCSTTWATSPPGSRSAACSTRGTSWPMPSSTRVACTCRPPRS